MGSPPRLRSLFGPPRPGGRGASEVLGGGGAGREVFVLWSVCRVRLLPVVPPDCVRKASAASPPPRGGEGQKGPQVT